MRRLLIAIGLLALSAAPALAYMILATTAAPPPANANVDKTISIYAGGYGETL